MHTRRLGYVIVEDKLGDYTLVDIGVGKQGDLGMSL